MDSFNLESDITNFYNFSDQLRLICSSYLNEKLDEDKLVNALEGIAILIEAHTDKTFDSFKKTLFLDEYNQLN